ncbi:raffinose/stachyose/melibiose transport system permease protein [Lederbergia galactosidilyticus]|uniref:carbohydrate ABC transporter permease n=1 Tax=Lederbergia galactosidilytica TaxID=217031 RepID=UPI001AE1F4CD|nr:sugar ABC transporter permease [Lederbergia galactosidilytica]MBP1913974.1 raffinose/stachyose/melibiose transport system permease protein [Lederbergia galactosidilytica]
MNRMTKKLYPYYFLLPAILIYGVLFIWPTVMSLFYSMTWWTLEDWEFIGLENFIQFFQEPSLRIGFQNTLLFAFTTMIGKTVIGFLLAAFLCSRIRNKDFLRSIVFFPALLSTFAVGVTFKALMHPTTGVINSMLERLGISGPNWLGDPSIALFSVALTDIWKGVGIATVIFIAGILAIPAQYYEAFKVDGGNSFQSFLYLTIPLSKPAMNTVITLALIGGLRNFDLIWAMTGGGPGFNTDLLASIVYKQYASGFFGLATAGNVLLFFFVAIIAFPIFKFLNRKEVDL